MEALFFILWKTILDKVNHYHHQARAKQDDDFIHP